ncbi:hypothetical protein BN1013_00154 [Candidatus Rubidus massiliensis]|nr:MAG: hypothetical protein BGO10_07705 [Chlamydia sp. 32-24]CDZ79658.1 hypothetical protein BN1013_00154 [Candidatus Rubidus massiliensis]
MSSVESKSPWTVQNFFTNMSAAAVGVFPFAEMFRQKAYQQMGQKAPSLDLKNNLASRTKVASGFGPMVALQVIVEEDIKLRLFEKNGQKASDWQSGVASLSSAVLTTPLMIAFNGVLAKMPLKTAFRKMNKTQVALTVLREAVFLFSMSYSKKASKYVEEKTENKAVNHMANVATVGAGAFLNHPMDTFLTRTQNGLSLHPTDAYRGVVKRVGAVCGTVFVYKQLLMLKNTKD